MSLSQPILISPTPKSLENDSSSKNVYKLEPARWPGLCEHPNRDHHGSKAVQQSRASLLEDKISVEQFQCKPRKRCEAPHSLGLASSRNGHI